MKMDDLLKIDLHVHTRASPDGAHSLRTIAKHAKKIGLDGLAITDHNVLLSKGIAKEISREFKILIIPGIEGGDMMNGRHWLGLFMDTIPDCQSILGINRSIRDEGGISIAPHPFSRLGFQNYIQEDFDAVEGLNGTTPWSNETFRQHQKKIPVTAGSDAHTISMLGYTWTRIDATRSIEEVIEAIRKGRCAPDGTVIPYLNRTLKFYSSVAARHLCSSPSEILSVFRQAWSGSPGISKESDG